MDDLRYPFLTDEDFRKGHLFWKTNSPRYLPHNAQPTAEYDYELIHNPKQRLCILSDSKFILNSALKE